MKEVIDEAMPPASDGDVQGTAELTVLNEQALRYIAGYVPMKLKKKYLKQTCSPHALAYFECLASMHEQEEGADEDNEFLQYTKIWVEKVNRECLFTVNNNTYLLFRAMELAVRKTLSIQQIGKEPSLRIKEEMKRIVMNDTVMAHWSVILAVAPDMDGNNSYNLLGKIADKWISIQSNSFASGWIEQHRCSIRRSSRAKALKKELVQSSKDFHTKQS